MTRLRIAEVQALPELTARSRILRISDSPCTPSNVTFKFPANRQALGDNRGPLSRILVMR